MEHELNRLELELEDMATSMIFAKMTIQQVDSDLLQREDTLQEVHKMRAGACARTREVRVRTPASASGGWRALLTARRTAMPPCRPAQRPGESYT